MEQVLEVLSPVAKFQDAAATKLAPRLKRIDGAHIGLLWNAKAHGDTALELVGEKLKAAYPTVTIKLYRGALPCDKSLLEEAIAECDGVIAATADCGACTSWIAHDCVQIEKAGVPTVIIASAGFGKNIEASSKAFGVPGIQYATVPKVYNNLTREQARSQTADAYDKVIELLTSVPTPQADIDGAATSETFQFGESGETMEAFLQFNADFLSRDWGDGYPLLPPTKERVEKLMKGFPAAPDEELCRVQPGLGIATLRRVAVNAAMAGCEPQEMPVIIAALRAMSHMPKTALRSALMSTSAYAPLFLVNGPVATKIGINGQRCCMGPGKQNVVNLRIGRAILLSLKNLGRWYPGIMDLDSIGTTRKHIAVIAENEAESPWDPYHVSLGYKAEQSTVTVFFTSGEWDISFQGHIDGPQLARAIASFSGGNSSVGYFSALQGALTDQERHAPLGRVLIIPPPHAQPLADAGYSKRGLESFMFWQGAETIQRLREPAMKLFKDGYVLPEWRWIFSLSDEEAERRRLPVIERAEQYRIVVAGAVRGKDMLMPTRTDPFTEVITGHDAN
jgi:hypothetical protein